MTAARTYRNREAGYTVEAIQATAENTIDLLIWIGADDYRLTNDGVGGAMYLTVGPNAPERIWLNDWVLRDPNVGHPWRLPAAEFRTTYELDVPFQEDAYYVLARDRDGYLRASSGSGLLLAHPDDTADTARVWLKYATDNHHRRLYQAVIDFLISEGGQ